jgi:hypothetical protein
VPLLLWLPGGTGGILLVMKIPLSIRAIPFSSTSRLSGMTFQSIDADPLVRRVSNIAQICIGLKIIMFSCGARSNRGASSIAIISISVHRLLSPEARYARCAYATPRVKGKYGLSRNERKTAARIAFDPQAAREVRI